MPPFQVQKIDHIVLRAKAPLALERFYTEVLGCTVERRQPHAGLTQLRAGESLIDLIDAAAGPPAPAGRNLDHLCLRVEPFDEAAIRAHLAVYGVAAGETLSRYGAEGEGPSLYLDDPEGTMVELKGPPARAS